MKAMLSRVFSRKEGPQRPFGGNSTVSSELSNSDIENYYLRIICECLRRMLLPLDSFQVRVRRSGTGPTGLVAFAGYVRILKWDAVVTPVLLQNLPVIDSRIRKVVNASVILEGTHYAGLWIQASSAAEGCPKALLGLPCELVHQAGGPSGNA
ncbi:MAG TPA: hypothetical protein VN663_19420 [Ramlibacter sp.]|nr:hypothetical protein [Ramlibacter sp.]